MEALKDMVAGGERECEVKKYNNAMELAWCDFTTMKNG